MVVVYGLHRPFLFDVEYHGTPKASKYELFIVWQLQFKGDAWFGDDYSSLPGGLSPIQSSLIVE